MNAAVGPKEVIELVQRAQLSLCEMLAEMLGSSIRTVQRWAAAKSSPSEEQLRTLAVAVHPHDADLGRRLAIAGDRAKQSSFGRHRVIRSHRGNYHPGSQFPSATSWFLSLH